MQNRMWKIEFTKQLSIELIYILHWRGRERERGGQEEGERKEAREGKTCGGGGDKAQKKG